MNREFRIFAEIPDGKGGIFHEEVDYLCQENYPDEVDISYFRTVALDAFPDAIFVQVYELAEEIKIQRGGK